MELRIDNKVAFVAGSSRGIGRAIAQALLAEGARVVISGRNAAELAKTENELRVETTSDKLMSFTGDLSQPADIHRALTQIQQRWNAIDILVANIGSGRGDVGWRADAEEWQRLCEINLFSAVRLVTAALPLMVEQKHGSIIFVSSITGLESSNAPLAYSSAKAALLSYMKNLSSQLAPAGVRVNAVAPGNVLFPGGSWEKHLESRREEVMRFIESEVPMQRFGKPEEIADAVAFLCSGRASFITGACLAADGGQMRSL